MIKAEKMQDGRVQIMNVNPIFNDVETKIVCFSQGDPRLDAAAGEPHCESLRMMVPAEAAAGFFVRFDHGSPAKFTAQITSVSSSNPRCFRSLIRAALPLSVASHCCRTPP